MEGPRVGRVRELRSNWASALCKQKVGNTGKTPVGIMREGRAGKGPSAGVAGTQPRDRARRWALRPRVLGPVGVAAGRRSVVPGPPKSRGDSEKVSHAYLGDEMELWRHCVHYPANAELSFAGATRTQSGLKGTLGTQERLPQSQATSEQHDYSFSIQPSTGLLCTGPVGATVSLPKVIPFCSVCSPAAQNTEVRGIQGFS